MRYKRELYISPQLASEAVKSKISLEALAITLGVKITFVDSIVKDASTTRMMHLLHIGHARYRLALSYALKRGWLVREGNNLRATCIKQLDAHNVRFVLNKTYYGKKRTGDIRCPFNITQLCDLIRQSILLHHITKQAVVYDTIKKATHPKYGTSTKTIKRARKRACNWGMCKPSLREGADRLSYARISQIAGCSATKAKSLVKELVNEGFIVKQENYLSTPWSEKDYSQELVNNYALYGECGYLVLRDGKVFAQLANTYYMNRCVVKYIATDKREKQAV